MFFHADLLTYAMKHMISCKIEFDKRGSRWQTYCVRAWLRTRLEPIPPTAKASRGHFKGREHLIPPTWPGCSRPADSLQP